MSFDILHEDTELVRNYQWISGGDLLRKFYAWNSADVSYGFLGWHFNPPQFEAARITNLWIVVHQRSFCTRIIQNPRSPFGVHSAQLWYCTLQTRRWLWMATMQLGPLFIFSERATRNAYCEGLRMRDFYMTDRTRKDRFVL